MAALILFSGILGLLLDGWPKASKLLWINIHAQVGLLVLALLIGRIWWRRTHTPPPLPPEVSDVSRRVSHPAHLLIYALMLVTPLVRIVPAWSRPKAPDPRRVMPGQAGIRYAVSLRSIAHAAITGSSDRSLSPGRPKDDPAADDDA